MKLDANIAFLSINAGHADQIGHSAADGGWYAAMHNVTRTNPRVPTTREKVDWLVARGGLGLHIHNPGGLNPPDSTDILHGTYAEMIMHQAWYSTKRLMQLDPRSERYKTWVPRLNWFEFIQAAIDFPHKLSVWIGGPQNFRPLCPGETKYSIFERIKASLLPFSRCCHYIFFDSLRGSHPNYGSFYNGPNGLSAMTINHIESLSVIAGNEISYWVNDESWMGHLHKMATEQHHRNKDRINWAMQPPYDPCPLHKPGEGDNWYIIVDTKYAANTPIENQKIVDKINKCQQDYPSAKMVVYAGHLNFITDID